MQSANGNLLWVYKHHAAVMHLADQFKRHGLLVSLFTQERRHKMPTRFIKDRGMLNGFERGVIEEITLQYLLDLKAELWKCGLHGPRDPKRTLCEALFASFPEAKDFKVSSAGSLSTGAVANLGDAITFRCNDEAVVGELWTIFLMTRFGDSCDDAVCLLLFFSFLRLSLGATLVLRCYPCPWVLPLSLGAIFALGCYLCHWVLAYLLGESVTCAIVWMFPSHRASVPSHPRMKQACKGEPLSSISVVKDR